LNPQTPEVSFFCSSVAVCIHLAFFVCIFGHRPDIFPPTKLSLNSFQNLSPFGPGCY
jgi:hypothetical protein